MNYRFEIQAGNPSSILTPDERDEMLLGAIEGVFPFETERAVLVWNHVLIPLSYKYTFPYIIRDLTGLLEWLSSGVGGSRQVQWGSSEFFGTWKVECRAGLVEIEARWDAVSGGLERELNSRPRLQWPTVKFIREWKRPLKHVVFALCSAGYGSELPGLSALFELVKGIDAEGELYPSENGPGLAARLGSGAPVFFGSLGSM